MKYCSHCGNQLLDEAEICPKCGCRVANPKAVKDEVQQTIDLYCYITLILTFFLSFIGSIIGVVVYRCKLKELGIDVREAARRQGTAAKACLIIAEILVVLEALSGIITAIIIMAS